MKSPNGTFSVIGGWVILNDFYQVVYLFLINRLRLGNFGDCKTIKGATGLYEVRIHLSPGYRLYFGKVKDTLVIILCGGDKGTQERDIQKAKKYWQFYKDSLKQR